MKLTSENAILNLFDLGKSYNYSIQDIEYWYKANLGLYKEIKATGTICSKCQDSFCFCDVKSNDAIFMKQMELFQWLVGIYKDEGYFERQLRIYDVVKNNPHKLKALIQKNEERCIELYFTFSIELLNEEQPEKLSVNVNDLFDIFISRDTFKHTSKFMDLFEQLYYEEEILPEALQKTDREIEADNDKTQFERRRIDQEFRLDKVTLDELVNYKDRSNVATLSSIIFFENEELLVFTTYEKYLKELHKVFHKLKEFEVPQEEEVVFHEVLHIVQSGGVRLNDLSSHPEFIRRWNFAYGYLLEKECVQVFDKKQSRFIEDVHVVTDIDRIGTPYGTAGRAFYVNDILVHKTM